MFIKIVGINDDFLFDRRQTYEIFLNPFEDHCGEEDAAEGQSMVKHKTTELLLGKRK